MRQIDNITLYHKSHDPNKIRDEDHGRVRQIPVVDDNGGRELRVPEVWEKPDDVT